MDESLLQANLDNVKYIVDTVGHTAQADQNPIDIKYPQLDFPPPSN